MSKHRNGSNNWIGIVLIIIGALFLLDTFDIMNFGGLFSDWWPAIFIIVGLIKLQGQDRGAGIVFIIIGTVLLLVSHDVIDWSSIWKLWPLILILVGLSMVFKGRHTNWSFSNESTIDNDFIHSNAVFGGAENLITSQNFKGGETMALFGGVELDLRDAKLSPDGCKVHATALFGGVEIRVPTDWKVIVTGTPIFGGIENKSRGNTNGDSSKEVHLHCTVAFGGVEIK